MRVLHVIGAMDRGGAETMIMNLYRAIDRTRVQFDFLVHEQRVCDYDEEIEQLGGRVFRCLPRFSGVNYFHYRRLCRSFFEEHKEHPIVHGHIASSSAIYLREAKRSGRIAIAHSHAQNYPISISELGFRMVTYPTRLVADRFLACSHEAGRDRFGESVVQGDRFHVVKNAIDVDEYASDALEHERAKRALGYEGSLLVGHVGRFEPVKNHRFLIEVFAKVAQCTPRAKLVLVGRGPGEEVLRGQVHALGLDDRVVFFGVSDHVPEVLKAFDVFVFPSFSEGLSMAAVEAQAAGVPCILSTGVPELAVVAPHMVQRLPLESGSAMWAEAVNEACDLTADRACGASLARKCGYDVSDAVRWLEEYYIDLTERRSS